MMATLKEKGCCSTWVAPESGVAHSAGSRRTLCLNGQITMPLPSLIVVLKTWISREHLLQPLGKHMKEQSGTLRRPGLQEQGTPLVVCGNLRAIKTHHEYELRWSAEHESRNATRTKQLDLPRRIRATTIQKHRASAQSIHTAKGDRNHDAISIPAQDLTTAAIQAALNNIPSAQPA